VIAEEMAREKVRVLVAEDNLINQKVTVHLLKKMGCLADVVGDGAAALEALRLARYDLVFMDCQMPVMDGYAATGKIRSLEGEARTTPIIAMTANAMEGDRERCLAAGMDDYVSKPVSSDEIRRVLGRWSRVKDAAASSRDAETTPISR
jgi:CheY-like chemotaxis protein